MSAVPAGKTAKNGRPKKHMQGERKPPIFYLVQGWDAERKAWLDISFLHAKTAYLQKLGTSPRKVTLRIFRERAKTVGWYTKLRWLRLRGEVLKRVKAKGG